MTAPRQVLEGTTYLVTRRTSERRFFLCPSRQTTAIFGYLLAVLSERYGIVLHSACVLSNHFHVVLTDPHARLPDFHRDLDALVARAVNCSLGRWEAFWERDSYSAVRLETSETVLEKMVYVLANPVAAGLVRRGCDWPGLWSDPRLIGAEGILFERPREFFRPGGPLPASARLRFHPPPGFDAAELVPDLRDQLEQAEDRAASERNGCFMGAKRVLAQQPRARPAASEPRRRLSPRVACRNRWKRIETLLQLAAFRFAYREALAAWRAGVRDVVFPPGTWLMRAQHRVCCATPA